MRPDGSKDDLEWQSPKGFTLETVVPDGGGGLYLVAGQRTLHLKKGAQEPLPFVERGSSTGAAIRAKAGSLLLGNGAEVHRVDAQGKPTLLARGFGLVYGLVEDAAGRVIVSDWERGEVVRIEGDTRRVLARGLSYPSGLVLGPKGDLYVKESGRMTHRDMRILRIDTAGTRTLFATVPSVSRWARGREDAESVDK